MRRDEWVTADPARHAPEVDFGCRWTREPSDNLHRLSWNSGTGELYLTDTTTDTVIAEFGTWNSASAVAAAFPDLAARGARHGGIYYLAAIAAAVARPDAVQSLATVDRSPTQQLAEVGDRAIEDLGAWEQRLRLWEEDLEEREALAAQATINDPLDPVALPAEPVAREILAVAISTGDDLDTVAHGLNLDPSFVHAILLGHRHDISSREVASICAALDRTPDELWGGAPVQAPTGSLPPSPSGQAPPASALPCRRDGHWMENQPGDRSQFGRTALDIPPATP